jgi:hypothetical protein
MGLGAGRFPMIRAWTRESTQELARLVQLIRSAAA